MNRRILAIAAFALLFVILLFSNVQAASAIEIDQTGTVSTVINGSSFVLNNGETVNLVGIVTPQSGQNGYVEAKDYLTLMVQAQTVYLTIDNSTSTSTDLQCIAYIHFNSTHYENVNDAMLENNYAIPVNNNNPKFDPSTWSWFVSINSPVSSPTASPTLRPTPTATPYSPSPPPTITPNYSPISTKSPGVPEFPTLIPVIIVSLATAILIVSQHFKKRK